MLKWFCKNNHQQRRIAMNRNHFNIDEVVRKSGSHLTLAERGMIQALHKEGMSLRGIAKNVGYAHTTVYYELLRGTPPRKSKYGM